MFSLMRSLMCAMVLTALGYMNTEVASTPLLATLPTGPGLAARYPADRGLREDPAVLFADDIETATGEVLPKGLASEHGAHWNNRWDRSWGGCRVARETLDVHAGQQALELSLERPGSIGVSKRLDSSVDRLFVRYYIKYDERFPGAHHAGANIKARAPEVPSVHPGVKADGTNKFDVQLDHWSFDPAVPPPGQLVAYVYHMDQRHRWGEQFHPSGRTRPGANAARKLFGPSFVPRREFVPALGRWYAYELMAQANAPGMNDGRVAFWVDGRLVADFPNLRFRSVTSLGINSIDIVLYESRRPGLRRIWIDDIVVATAYIGPQAIDRGLVEIYSTTMTL